MADTLIPTATEDLDDLLRECQRQSTEVADIFASTDPTVLRLRPSPKKWSMAGHLAHLVLVNRAYVSAIEKTVDQALAAGGPRGDGPFRHPRFAIWFANAQAPPPRMRLKTFRSMVPDPDAEVDDALEAFTALQRRLADVIQASRGLDLGAVRFRSPLLALVRVSLGTGFALVLEHNRRHVWLIHEVNRGLPRG